MEADDGDDGVIDIANSRATDAKQNKSLNSVGWIPPFDGCCLLR